MQLNIKVIKKWQPPISTSTPPFQGYLPYLAKLLVPPQVTQFFEGPTPLPPLIRERGVPTMCINNEKYYSQKKSGKSVS